jgi:cryptochrome
MPPGNSDHKSSGQLAAIHWFRHGLRLHDNPALLEALDYGGDFYPIFIFDGEVAGRLYLLYLRVHVKEVWMITSSMK